MLGVGGENFARARLIRVDHVDRRGLVVVGCVGVQRHRSLILVIAAAQRLPRGEALGDGHEQMLVWAGTRQTKTDAPGIAPDDGANLQQLEADRASLSAGQFGARQAQPPDRGQQAISKTGKEQAELVWPPFVA